MNGWTDSNCGLRALLLQSLEPDFISLNETHLKNDNVITLEGYTWFGQNRNMHIKAPKASGGVGIFVKDQLLQCFKVTIVDKAVDGILALRFEHRVSQYVFVIFSCYLSPEGSTRGRDSLTFFSHLLCLVYYLEADAVYICGDFNSRIADKEDCLVSDGMPPRIAKDLTLNKHGDTFINFIKDSKCCIVNGRVTPLNDDFTSISPKGKAVVDYIMVSQDCLNLCTEFQVITPNDLMENNGPDCLNLLGDRCKMPDHSLLWLKFKASAERYLTVHPTADISKTRRPRVFPDNFLSSELCCTVLLDLISNIEACRVIRRMWISATIHFAMCCMQRWIDTLPLRPLSQVKMLDVSLKVNLFGIMN